MTNDHNALGPNRSTQIELGAGPSKLPSTSKKLIYAQAGLHMQLNRIEQHDAQTIFIQNRQR